MRHLILLLLLGIMISCSHPINKNDILGSWKMEDEWKSQTGVVDTIMFFPNGTSTTNVFINDVLQQSYTVKYDIDTEKHLLFISTDTSKQTFKIVELTSNRLMIKPLESQEGIIKYLR